MEDCIDLDNDNICGICYAEFLDIDDLKLHIIQYHLNERSKYRFCDFCSRIFSDIEAYALHLRNSHISTFRTCKYCTRVYNDDYSLSRHEKKHKSSFYYPKIACSNCIKVFKNKRDLEQHEYEKHRNSDDGVMLQHCFPELSSLININIRKFLKGLHENYLYKCVVCKLSTWNVSEYIDHLVKVKCRSISCNICCNVYTWRSALELHCKTHIKQSENLYNGHKQCPKCDKYFVYTKLRSHLKECASMKCMPCNVSFDSVEKFAEHVTTHTHRTPLQFEICKYCRRPFIGFNSLEKHIERSHRHNLHQYKYSCIYCDIVFKHPKLLFGHFFTKHKDINPYTCKICNIDYRIRKNFTLHIKLDHKSVGFVEFNSNFHVFFTDKKSENPFQPKNPYITELINKSSDQEMTVNEDSNVTMIEQNDANDNEIIVVTDNSNEKSNIDVVTNNITIITESDVDLKIDKTGATVDATNHSSTVDKDTGVNEEKGMKKDELCHDESDNAGLQNKDVIKSNVTIEKVEINSNESKVETENNANVKLVNVNSDFMTVTETEVDQTEKEVKRNVRVQKRKTRIQPTRSRKRRKTERRCDDSKSSDDSDVPLSTIVSKKPRHARKIKRRNTLKGTISGSKMKQTILGSRKMKFICFKCDRNCYTYQNYHRHMSLHMKKSHKTCVKCFAKFDTKDRLNEHMKVKHSSSELTETLKKLLDKRKSNEKIRQPPPLQKVPIKEIHAPATITALESDKISVKNFLENFKPDTNDVVPKKISISNSLSIRPVATGETRTFIKMTKFNPEPKLIDHRPQLKMPVKFQTETMQDHKVTIKLVYCDNVATTLNLNSEIGNTDSNKSNTYQSVFEESHDNVPIKNEAIPEVGREILLENKDSRKVNLLKNTIVLKDLLPYSNLSIGHLAPKAPFYKIVKIDEVLKEKQEVKEPPKPINITLPNGTKLVSVNPLAHLLGNKSVADIPKLNSYKNKSYSYKPKMQDFGQAIVNAMKALDKTPPKKKSTKKIDEVK